MSQIDEVDTTVVVPDGGTVLLGDPVPKAKPPVKQEVETPEGGKSLLGGTVKAKPPVKQEVLTPEEAVKMAGNATKPAVEFKVEFVTKAIQVKASGEKDAAWVHGHSPNDVCLGTLIAADDPLRKTRFVAILTEKAIKQFNKAGINDLEKHFKGKTVRVIGLLVPHFRNRGSLREVEVVLDDMSQLEVVK